MPGILHKCDWEEPGRMDKGDREMVGQGRYGGIEGKGTVYGLFECPGGHFVSEGTVMEVKVKFQDIGYQKEYSMLEFGKSLFLDKEEARKAAEDAGCTQYESEREEPGKNRLLEKI